MLIYSPKYGDLHINLNCSGYNSNKALCINNIIYGESIQIY